MQQVTSQFPKNIHASIHPTFSSASLDLLNFRNSVVLDSIGRVISTAHVCVVSIFDMEKISTLLNMVSTTEESIHLLERNFLGLRNEKPDEGS